MEKEIKVSCCLKWLLCNLFTLPMDTAMTESPFLSVQYTFLIIAYQEKGFNAYFFV